jgi:hypothetical protein
LPSLSDPKNRIVATALPTMTAAAAWTLTRIVFSRDCGRTREAPARLTCRERT